MTKFSLKQDVQWKFGITQKDIKINLFLYHFDSNIWNPAKV